MAPATGGDQVLPGVPFDCCEQIFHAPYRVAARSPRQLPASQHHRCEFGNNYFIEDIKQVAYPCLAGFCAGFFGFGAEIRTDKGINTTYRIRLPDSLFWRSTCERVIGQKEFSRVTECRRLENIPRLHGSPVLIDRKTPFERQRESHLKLTIELVRAKMYKKLQVFVFRRKRYLLIPSRYCRLVRWLGYLYTQLKRKVYLLRNRSGAALHAIDYGRGWHL